VAYLMKNSIVIDRIRFTSGKQARAVQAPQHADPKAILDALGLGSPRALIVISGGAGRMSEDEIVRLRPLFVDGLARLAAQERIAVLDGGTNAGVMALTGEGAARHGLTAPLIGVCPVAKVFWPGHPNPLAEAELEPHHSHFVLTGGAEFGSESQTIYALAEALSQQVPSLALIVNGGPITYREALMNVEQGRPLVVFKGSGRAADGIAEAWEKRQSDDPRAAEIVRCGKIVVFDVVDGPERLVTLIQETFRRSRFNQGEDH